MALALKREGQSLENIFLFLAYCFGSKRSEIPDGIVETEGQCISFKPGGSPRKKAMVLKSQNSGKRVEIDESF